jgi:hypothetical protein
MDGDLLYGYVLRVSQRQGGLMVWSLDVAGVPAHIHSPHAGWLASDLYETPANPTNSPSIVGTLLVRVLHACTLNMALILMSTTFVIHWKKAISQLWPAGRHTRYYAAGWKHGGGTESEP